MKAVAVGDITWSSTTLSAPFSRAEADHGLDVVAALAGAPRTPKSEGTRKTVTSAPASPARVSPKSFERP